MVQVSSLAVHTPSAATTLPLKTSPIHTLLSNPGAHHEDFLSSGAALASKTELPGQICLEFVLTEGLCQAWEGSRGRLNFVGEALKELMALPASEWNGIGEIVETLKNVPL